MNADGILTRDSYLRDSAAVANDHRALFVDDCTPGERAAYRYLANIAAAERALIEAVGAWRDLTWKVGEPDRARNVTAEIGETCHAYDALLAAMEEAQR